MPNRCTPEKRDEAHRSTEGRLSVECVLMVPRSCRRAGKGAGNPAAFIRGKGKAKGLYRGETFNRRNCFPSSSCGVSTRMLSRVPFPGMRVSVLHDWRSVECWTS